MRNNAVRAHVALPGLGVARAPMAFRGIDGTRVPREGFERSRAALPVVRTVPRPEHVDPVAGPHAWSPPV